jgi:hypothetical protein
MVVDWLAAGVDPAQATLFIQSKVPEHAELHLLLSMITPLSWLERVPTYKDQQEKLAEKDLATYGFLGYPLLQSADILIYRANLVPVGEDQVPHVGVSTMFLGVKQALRKRPKLRSKNSVQNAASCTASCAPTTLKKGMAMRLPLRAPCWRNRKICHWVIAKGFLVTLKAVAKSS